MGAWGGIIMSFFSCVFAAMTLALQMHWHGPMLGVPFVAFAMIAFAGVRVLRLPGVGVVRSERAGRVIMWSTIGEGIGLFVAANVVVNLGRSDLLLPAMALIVGLHFLPMGRAIPFKPFYVLGSVLLISAIAGLALTQPVGGTVAGFASAAALTVAAILAVDRDRRARSR